MEQAMLSRKMLQRRQNQKVITKNFVLEWVWRLSEHLTCAKRSFWAAKKSAIILSTRFRSLSSCVSWRLYSVRRVVAWFTLAKSSRPSAALAIFSRWEDSLTSGGSRDIFSLKSNVNYMFFKTRSWLQLGDWRPMHAVLYSASFDTATGLSREGWGRYFQNTFGRKKGKFRS